MNCKKDGINKREGTVLGKGGNRRTDTPERSLLTASKTIDTENGSLPQ